MNQGLLFRVIVCLTVSLVEQGASAVVAQDYAQDQTTAFAMQYISATARELKCYVTVERIYDPEGRVFSVFKTGEVPIGEKEKVKTIDQFIAKLRRDLKTVAVVRNKHNPKILHLIEEGFQEEKGYPLDEKASVEFKGILGELAERLQRDIPAIGARQGGDFLDMFDDLVTEVTVKAKNESVRDILTKAVPLNRYGPLLWVAETQKRDGKLVTQVQYFGPRKEFWPKPDGGPAAKKPVK